MGLLEQEITEIRQMMRNYDAGKLTTEQIHVKIAMYSQVEKRAKLMLQAFAMAAKHKKSVLTQITQSNLIGDGAAIDLPTCGPEEENVKCPMKDNEIISRQKCLDLSGENKNYEECSGCKVGTATKRLLLGIP